VVEEGGEVGREEERKPYIVKLGLLARVWGNK